jgi:hypothetical protein
VIGTTILFFKPYRAENKNPAEAGLGDRLRAGRVNLHSTCEVSAKAQIPYRGDFLPLSGKTEKQSFSVGQQTT